MNSEDSGGLVVHPARRERIDLSIDKEKRIKGKPSLVKTSEGGEYTTFELAQTDIILPVGGDGEDGEEEVRPWMSEHGRPKRESVRGIPILKNNRKSKWHMNKNGLFCDRKNLREVEKMKIGYGKDMDLVGFTVD